jgi:hypothetical protein
MVRRQNHRSAFESGQACPAQLGLVVHLRRKIQPTQSQAKHPSLNTRQQICNVTLQQHHISDWVARKRRFFAAQKAESGRHDEKMEATSRSVCLQNAERGR